MDYTLSNSYDTDTGTGHRLHNESQAVPTAWSEQDANSVIWSLMAIVEAAGLTGLQFDKDTPATYQQVLTAIRLLRPGGLIGVQVFSTVGTATYTPSPGTVSVLLELQGGGGGGGGSAATSASQLAAGSGGNGGTYAKSRITGGFAGVPVTVGAAGLGGAVGANGGAGGTSSFGGLVSAPGGAGGNGGAALIPPGMTPAPINSAIASGGNLINASSHTGLLGQMLSTSYGLSGAGGDSLFGAGPSGTSSPGGGGVAGNYGCGGAGALSGASSGGNGGGLAAKGVVIVWELS